MSRTMLWAILIFVLSDHLTVHALHGGELVLDIEEVPYMLSVWHFSKPICGATVLGPYWAVTSASCLQTVDVDYLDVHSSSVLLISQSVVNYPAVAIYTHPNYSPTTHEFDVGLIQVNSSLPGYTSIEGTNNLLAAGTVLDVYGWGPNIIYGTTFSNALAKTSVVTVTKGQCSDHYNGMVISDRIFCAIGPSDGTEAPGPCEGDFGGPAIFLDPVHGGRAIAGISSYVTNCADPEVPVIYTRINHPDIVDWITYQTDNPDFVN